MPRFPHLYIFFFFQLCYVSCLCCASHFPDKHVYIFFHMRIFFGDASPTLVFWVSTPVIFLESPVSLLACFE